MHSAGIQPLLQANGTVWRKQSWETEDGEQCGKDIKVPDNGRQDQCEQDRSDNSHIPRTAHPLLGFVRKKEMHKPGEQHSQANQRNEKWFHDDLGFSQGPSGVDELRFEKQPAKDTIQKRKAGEQISDARSLDGRWYTSIRRC